MNEYIVNFLNSIPLGTALVVIIAVAGTFFATYTKFKKYKDIYDQQVITENQRRLEEDTYKSKVNELSDKIDVLADTINSVNEKIEGFENTINDKLDQVNKDIEQNHTINNNKINEMSREIQKHTSELTEIKKSLEGTNDKVKLLVESDKEDIKAYVTQEYNKWIPQGHIDLITLQSIEARYSKYVEEKGNGFVKKMIDDLRNLPTTT